MTQPAPEIGPPPAPAFPTPPPLPPRYDPPKRRQTNGFATGTLILAVLGFAPVAIVLGIVALLQIRRHDHGGKGLAIAGLAVSEPA